MRYLLPATAAAVALTVGVATAPAASHHHHHKPKRAKSHVTLHLSGHTVLSGNGVACGGTLMPGTLGVAHKTLPCGTMVKLRYHGRSITVPVIDRGPYVAGRDYDLTEATRDRLGFPGVDTVLADH
jgi:uncharacterized membrane protein